MEQAGNGGVKPVALPTPTVHVALLAVSATATAALGGYAFRHRRAPGAVPFLAWMASLTVWSVAYAVGLLVADPFWRLLLQRTAWFGIATVPVCLFLFTLVYTGHDEYVTRNAVALLCSVPVAVVVGVWTNPWHHLLWASQSVVVHAGVAVMDPSYGPLFWGHVIYSYGLIAVGAALLVRLIHQSEYLYTDQSLLLLVGIAAPFAANAVDVFVALPRPGVDFTPHAFTVTGIAFGYALFRRQLFDLVPATRLLGRDAAISQLDDGVVIVDTSRRIVYCNEAAGDILGCDPADALGREVRSLIDDSRIDFEARDGLAEIEHDERVYEGRTSPIIDHRDRLIGHTLITHDVTARKERERRLAAQRDELATVNDLNAVIRGVNRALVAATSREEIERVVCDRVVDADLYRTARIGDVATWSGDADRWFVAGDDGTDTAPPRVDGEDLDVEDRPTPAEGRARPVDPHPAIRPGDGGDGQSPATDADGERATHENAVADGTWTVVPLVYGRTVFGALGLYTDRNAVSERERAVLSELGETIGQAINAVETRRLLSAEAVVELELESEDAADPLLSAATETGCRLDVAGLVPGSDGGVAYVRVDGGDVDAVCEHVQAMSGGRVRVVRAGDDGGLVEWQVGSASPLGLLADHGANVTRARADGDAVRYALEVPSDADRRALTDAVQGRFPDTRVVSKRERARPIDRPDTVGGETLSDLTDRQREAIEAAYRAGYFNWPRDSTAEDVAETLDISSATLHSHLRKGQATMFEDVFDDGTG